MPRRIPKGFRPSSKTVNAKKANRLPQEAGLRLLSARLVSVSIARSQFNTSLPLFRQTVR
jgi:hypothetical protein